MVAPIDDNDIGCDPSESLRGRKPAKSGADNDDAPSRRCRRRSVAPGYARPFSEIIHRIPIVTDPCSPRRADLDRTGRLSHRWDIAITAPQRWRLATVGARNSGTAYIVTPAGSAGIGGAVPQVKRHSERQRE